MVVSEQATRMPYVVIVELLLQLNVIQALGSEVSTAFESANSLAVGVEDSQEHVSISQYGQLHRLLNQATLPFSKTDL